MAKYTMLLDDLIKEGINLNLQEYPIWDESYRKTLNDKLIAHYRFYEIGFETPALFVWWLNMAMNEIMPYYNQRYKTTLYDLDPTNPINITETGNDKLTGNTNSNSRAKNRNLFSETPQGPLEEVENGKYLTTADFTENNNNSTANQNNERTYSHARKGNETSDLGALINSFRDSFINIDMEVIEDTKIQQCFMQVL